jgi:hypothetical protein
MPPYVKGSESVQYVSAFQVAVHKKTTSQYVDFMVSSLSNFGMNKESVPTATNYIGHVISVGTLPPVHQAGSVYRSTWSFTKQTFSWFFWSWMVKRVVPHFGQMLSRGLYIFRWERWRSLEVCLWRI